MGKAGLVWLMWWDDGLLVLCFFYYFATFVYIAYYDVGDHVMLALTLASMLAGTCIKKFVFCVCGSVKCESDDDEELITFAHVALVSKTFGRTRNGRGPGRVMCWIYICVYVPYMWIVIMFHTNTGRP